MSECRLLIKCRSPPHPTQASYYGASSITTPGQILRLDQSGSTALWQSISLTSGFRVYTTADTTSEQQGCITLMSSTVCNRCGTHCLRMLA